jgi:hypothetical protein
VLSPAGEVKRREVAAGRVLPIVSAEWARFKAGRKPYTVRDPLLGEYEPSQFGAAVRRFAERNQGRSPREPTATEREIVAEQQRVDAEARRQRGRDQREARKQTEAQRDAELQRRLAHIKSGQVWTPEHLDVNKPRGAARLAGDVVLGIISPTLGITVEQHREGYRAAVARGALPHPPQVDRPRDLQEINAAAGPAQTYIMAARQKLQRELASHDAWAQEEAARLHSKLGGWWIAGENRFYDQKDYQRDYARIDRERARLWRQYLDATSVEGLFHHLRAHGWKHFTAKQEKAIRALAGYYEYDTIHREQFIQAFAFDQAASLLSGWVGVGVMKAVLAPLASKLPLGLQRIVSGGIATGTAGGTQQAASRKYLDPSATTGDLLGEFGRGAAIGAGTGGILGGGLHLGEKAFGRYLERRGAPSADGVGPGAPPGTPATANGTSRTAPEKSGAASVAGQEQPPTEPRGRGAGEAAFSAIASFRTKAGLPDFQADRPNTGAVARIVVGPRAYYGINTGFQATGEPKRVLRRDAFETLKEDFPWAKNWAWVEFLKHAEALALLRAARSGKLPRRLVMHVDRKLCGWCRSQLPHLMRKLEVEEIVAQSADGSVYRILAE